MSTLFPDMSQREAVLRACEVSHYFDVLSSLDQTHYHEAFTPNGCHLTDAGGKHYILKIKLDYRDQKVNQVFVVLYSAQSFYSAHIHFGKKYFDRGQHYTPCRIWHSDNPGIRGKYFIPHSHRSLSSQIMSCFEPLTQVKFMEAAFSVKS